MIVIQAGDFRLASTVAGTVCSLAHGIGIALAQPRSRMGGSGRTSLRRQPARDADETNRQPVLKFGGPDHHIRSMTVQVTKREKEILALMSDGKTAQEIAMILGCSVHTVRTHIEALKTNFSVYKDTALVAAALRQRIIE